MRYSFLTLLLFLSLRTLADPGIIQLDRQSYTNIGKQVAYFEDKSNVMGLEQAKERDKEGKFSLSKVNILNFGNTKSAFWLRIRYLNNTNAKGYLIIDVPNIEYIDYYACWAGKNIRKVHSGCLAPDTKGVIARNNFIFSLPEPINGPEVVELYLRVKTNNVMLLPVKIATHETYTAGSSVKEHLESVYIGVLLTLLLFNIFLYISMREKMYLYYCLYLFAGFIYLVLYLRGYAYLFGYDFRTFLNRYPHGFLALSSMAGILFSWKFLNVPALAPKMKFLFYPMMVCGILLLLTSILGFKGLAAEMTQYTIFLVSIGLGAGGFIAWKRGHHPAKYYIVAWIFRAGGVVLITLNIRGVFEMGDYSFEIFPVATTVEMLLLAFALGDRYSNLIKSERAVREENLLLTQTQNQRLEKVVEERTMKLSDAIVELESSNAVKDKLFSIIAHDLRTPFNSLLSIFSLKDMDMLNFEELKMLLNENRKNIEQMRHTLDNLLYWAKDQMEMAGPQFSKFELKTLAEELMPVYRPLAQSKSIDLILSVSGKTLVYADQNQVQLILRNLIDNAIKFTPGREEVSINLEANENRVRVGILNPVANPDEVKTLIAESSADYRSTKGTANERGIGLGLQLCREYVKINGGELEQRIEGNEVEFYFSLQNMPQLS